MLSLKCGYALLDHLKVDALKTFSPPAFCPASRKQNIKRKKKTSPFLQFSQDLSKQPIRGCDGLPRFYLVQVLSSVFANIGVHHRLVLMKGVLAARVIQLRVYHRALEQSKGQSSQSGLSLKGPDERFSSHLSQLPSAHVREQTEGDVVGFFLENSFFLQCCRVPVQFQLLVKCTY